MENFKSSNKSLFLAIINLLLKSNNNLTFKDVLNKTLSTKNLIYNFKNKNEKQKIIDSIVNLSFNSNAFNLYIDLSNIIILAITQELKIVYNDIPSMYLALNYTGNLDGKIVIVSFKGYNYIVEGSVKYSNIDIFLNNDDNFLNLYNIYYVQLEQIIINREISQCFTVDKINNLFNYKNYYTLNKYLYSTECMKKELHYYNNLRSCTSINYTDLDGLYGFYRLHDFFKSVKTNLYIEIGNKSKPINKNIHINSKSGFRKLKNILTTSIGHFNLFEGKCYIYLCSMDNEQLENINSFLMNIYNYIFEKLKIYPCTLSHFLKNTKRTNDKFAFCGIKDFIYLISEFVDKDIKNYKSLFIYIEMFGMKFKTINLNIENIISEINTKVNIKNSNYLYVDFATSHYPTGSDLDKFVGVHEENLIELGFKDNIFYSLMNKNICNANFKSIKLINDKINMDSLFTKVNFYNPLFYNICNKKLRNYYFPKYSIKILLEKIKQNNNNLNINRYNIIFNDILIYLTDNDYNFSEYRLELQTNLHNIQYSYNFFEEIFNYKDFFTYNNFDIIRFNLIEKINSFFDFVQNISNTNLNINNIVFSSLYEMIFIDVILSGKINNSSFGNKDIYNLLYQNISNSINQYNGCEELIYNYVENLSTEKKIKYMTKFIKSSLSTSKTNDKKILFILNELIINLKNYNFDEYFLLSLDDILCNKLNTSIAAINNSGESILYPEENTVENFFEDILTTKIIFFNDLNYILYFYSTFLLNNEDEDVKNSLYNKLKIILKDKNINYLPKITNNNNFSILKITDNKYFININIINEVVDIVIINNNNGRNTDWTVHESVIMLIGYRYYYLLYPELSNIDIAKKLYCDYRFNLLGRRSPEQILERRKNIIKKLRYNDNFSIMYLNILNDIEYINESLLYYNIGDFKHSYTIRNSNSNNDIDNNIIKYLNYYNKYMYKINDTIECNNLQEYILCNNYANKFLVLKKFNNNANVELNINGNITISDTYNNTIDYDNNNALVSVESGTIKNMIIDRLVSLDIGNSNSSLNTLDISSKNNSNIFSDNESINNYLSDSVSEINYIQELDLDIQVSDTLEDKRVNKISEWKELLFKHPFKFITVRDFYRKLHSNLRTVEVKNEIQEFLDSMVEEGVLKKEKKNVIKYYFI